MQLRGLYFGHLWKALTILAVKVELLLSLVMLLVVNGEVASCQEVQSVVTDIV